MGHRPWSVIWRTSQGESCSGPMSFRPFLGSLLSSLRFHRCLSHRSLFCRLSLRILTLVVSIRCRSSLYVKCPWRTWSGQFHWEVGPSGLNFKAVFCHLLKVSDHRHLRLCHRYPPVSWVFRFIFQCKDPSSGLGTSFQPQTYFQPRVFQLPFPSNGR